MPVSANFSMETYSSRGERGRRSSESSSASDATRERRGSTGVMHPRQVSAEATESIPTRRKSVGPRPAANPMKFVAAGPTPLLRTASEQMLKAEKLRMAAKPAVKEEESAAWQNNLDNWKSSRRKRQEDVIERLTEVKKMEEDVGGSRRRAKTFGEMMQDRNGKGRRVLQVFTDDDNDISSLLSAKSPTSSDTKSDLGFATSSDTGSEPSDQQEPDKCTVSPTVGETNGHDSGTEEFTYEGAIQGYMKFAEKTAAVTRSPLQPPADASSSVVASSPSPAPSPAPGDAPPTRAEPSPRADSPLEKHQPLGDSRSAAMSGQSPASDAAPAAAPAPTEDAAAAPAAAAVRTGRPSVVLREKKAKVDVLKRRSMFEQRSDIEDSSPAAQRRQQRKSVDLSDGLRHRIASLETVSTAAGDDARWRPAAKGDQFRQKLAMFAGLESGREASADRRGPVEVPRQKSASDLRSRFERLASDEPAEPAERPRSALERGWSRRSEPETPRPRRLDSPTADSEPGAEPTAAETAEESSSLETAPRQAVTTAGAPERRVETLVSTAEWRVQEVSTVERRVEEVSTVERRVEEVSTVEVEQQQEVEPAAAPPPPLMNGRSLSPPPEPARVPPVPRETSVADDTNTATPVSWVPSVSPSSGPTPYTAPAATPVTPASAAQTTAPLVQPEPQPVLEPEPQPEPEPEPVPVPALETTAAPAGEPVVEEPVVTPVPPPAPAPVSAPPAVPSPAAPAVVPEEAGPAAPSEPVSLPWQDPAAAVDEMEARILRQLEESERSQMSAAEVPVVLDFTLQPSAAPPPTEKPPPPPPETEDEPAVEIRSVKSTTAVKKDLCRRRSDFLGIQGTAEPEPAVPVARPPDMESLLRQERAAQQEQERRRQARQESLRRAEEEAEARAEEFRRRAQQEQEQRAQERRALELQQEQERQQQEQERLQEQEQQRRAQEEQEQEWRRRSAPVVTAEPAQQRWSQEPLSDQEREWRRRKERLLCDEDEDRHDRQIMESLELEENWRHSQQRKYHSRLARMQAPESQWQQTQECPPAGQRAAPADLLSNRHQARSNPNLLQQEAGGDGGLLPSRSHGDLLSGGGGGGGHGPLQHSRSHGRLADSGPPPQPPPAAARHNMAAAAAPAKPQRSAEPEIRAPRPSSSRSHQPPSPAEAGAGPGQMTRHTLHTLSAAPRSNLRQEWVPRKRADAPRNTGQHWLIQEAEQRRISEQQERSSRQQQQQQQPAAAAHYQPPRAPPPLQQHAPPQHAPQPAAQPLPQHQYPTYYTQQPIYENTPAQLNSNNYHDINTIRSNGGPQLYPGPEARQGPPESVSPAAQSAEDRVLSVSGRKKCSHCGEELGRGAAMIIESLRLFYHINCFKCCVCNVQLGNGSMGADVRVRNNKLHCHDCYSNDDGIKFSKV